MEEENPVYGSMEILQVLRLVFLPLLASLSSSVFFVNAITSGHSWKYKGQELACLDREACGGT